LTITTDELPYAETPPPPSCAELPEMVESMIVGGALE
jgi:hypothetical protein